MIIFPYSTALTLARPPLVTHSTILICLLVFWFQSDPALTNKLMYFPDSWNPIKMVTSSLAHADLMHLLGNMIFFLAFAPALEILIGSAIRYLFIMLLISIAVGICYSIAVKIGVMLPWPTLGFSGVVMGMIGLSAYLMPHARIRVFFWYWFGWKIFYVPAWMLALIYMGLDTWTLLSAGGNGGVNLIAHLAGGIAGYGYAYRWLRDRKEEVEEELKQEIEAMNVRQKQGRAREESFRYARRMDKVKALKKQQQDFDQFMGKLYQMVKTHRDSEAICTLLTRYDLGTQTHELEQLFERMQGWGPSRTLLCMGRLIIQKLGMEKRYGLAVVYIEKCQSISQKFILPDVSLTLNYSQLAIEHGRQQIAQNLLIDHRERYGNLLNQDQCHHWLQKSGFGKHQEKEV